MSPGPFIEAPAFGSNLWRAGWSIGVLEQRRTLKEICGSFFLAFVFCGMPLETRRIFVIRYFWDLPVMTEQRGIENG